MKDTDVLQPGSIFLAAMDGGHAENAGSNLRRPPWMADMPQMQERFSAATARASA